MRRILLFILLALACSLWAQDTTVIGNAITSSNGVLYAHGSLTATLIDQNGNDLSSSPVLIGNVPVTIPQRSGNLDPSANFSIPLVPQATIAQPSNTRWRLSICSQNPAGNPGSNIPPMVCFPYIVTVGTTSPQDVSSAINALPPPPIQGGGGGGGGVCGNAGELIWNNSNTCASTSGMTWTPSSSYLNNPSGAINANFVGAGNIGVAAGGGYLENLPWNPAGGTLANEVVCLNAAGTVSACPINTVSWTGIAGTTSVTLSIAVVAISGEAQCQFDGPATVGDIVTTSIATAGYCHDAGGPTIPPPPGVLVGTVVSSSGSLGTVLLSTPTPGGPAGPTGATGAAGPQGPPGPTGSPVNLPGVHTDGNTPGGLAVDGSVTASSVVASSLPGYRQNQVSARSRNRDELLQITVTPQDFPGCQNSGGGLIDDRPCFTQALTYLMSTDVNVTKRLLVPYTPTGYTFRSNGYLQPMPHDFGDYHPSAGGGGAAAALQIVNGAIQSCTVSAGSGYAPSANLPVWINDSTLQGSGGWVEVQTDPTGTPTGCLVRQAGMSYPTTGVTANVFPIGGHGASATATLSGGSITAVTVATGGSGYTTQPPVPVGISGGNVGTNFFCTGPYPTFTANLSGTSVSTVTVNTAGTGCTWNGVNTVTIPAATVSTAPTPTTGVVFGGSCGGFQCAPLPPDPVTNIGCGAALFNNLTIEGVGNPTIFGGGPNFAFCEPTGINSMNITIKNLNFDGFGFAAWFPFEVYHLTMDNLNIGNNQWGLLYAYAFNGTTLPLNYVNVNVGMTSNPPYPPSVITNINDTGLAGIICGGAWVGRTSQTYQAGIGGTSLRVAAGGYQSMLAAAWLNWWGGFGAVGHLANDQTGRCYNIRVENFVLHPITDSGHQTSSTVIDKWFEQYVWKTHYGPASIPAALLTGTQKMANGTNACAGIQTGITMTDRTVDYNFGTFSLPQNYPFYQCYLGITYTNVFFVPRYSGDDQTFGVRNIQPESFFSNITQVTYDNRRPMFQGRFDWATEIVRATSTSVGTGTADPYLVGATQGGINISSQFGTHVKADDVLFLNSTNTGNFNSVPIQVLQQGININNRYSINRNIAFGYEAMTGYVSTGSSPTISGCGTPTNIVGGTLAGSFTANNAACTATFTFNTTSFSAPNGWRCSGTDIASQIPLNQSASTQNSCTITGSITAGHTVTWQAAAF
jgi:hypothetical protein